MTKVFLSQPMKGKTTEQIVKERKEALKIIKQYVQDAELIDTVINDEKKEKHPGLLYLAESLKLLDEADVMYVMKGWDHARGCVIENNTALLYDIPIRYLEEVHYGG